MLRPLIVRRPTREIAESSFLIVEPFGLGDLVAATALLKGIRDAFPAARVEVACHDRWASWVRQLPFVNGVRSHRFPWSTSPKQLGLKQIRDLATYVRELRRQDFDIGIDIRGDVRSQALLVGAGCPIRIGFRDYMGSNIVQRGLLLTHAMNCGVRSRLEELGDLLSSLGVGKRPLGMDIGRPTRESGPKSVPRVGIHVGAGWQFKKWSLANWQWLASALIQEFEVEIELLGSQTDTAELEAIAVAAGGRASVKTTQAVTQMIDRIGNLDLLICHDSAPLHIAAALGVAVIALFGPGEITRWGHLGENVISLHNQERFGCAPCTQTHCVSPNATCVNSIECVEVLNAARTVLGRVAEKDVFLPSRMPAAILRRKANS